MLQAAGLPAGQLPERAALDAPEALVGIHRAYVEAGANIIAANTFGANAKKLAGSGLAVEAVVEAAIACARQAAGGKALVALDVGPLGEMLEPGGTLHFEAATDLFAQVMRAGQAAGADLILIETMADLYEIRAAVLAAREHTTLPVMASMTFEAGGRTFSGVPVEAFASSIGPLGPVALGINCSLGPAGVIPLLRRLCAATNLPVFAKPNAGLPDPATGAFSLGAEAFCRQMQPCLDMGVSMVGGCCGTTPEVIALLAKQFAGKVPAKREAFTHSRVCGPTHVVDITGPVAIGERINPTGKPKLRDALLAGDLSLVQALAVEQEEAGALILDVNVGAPGADEVDLLPRAVKAVQAVSGLPLQLDSANPDALAAALRVCNGKAVVNSTSGEADKLAAVLPLCKQYGATVVGLALDEAGIPETAEGRLGIARRILEAALAEGIPRQDVFIDCLVLAAGAEPGAAVTTLKALQLVKSELGLRTLLGVSNVSFGLPNRPLVNQTFLAMALTAGLDMAIVNPGVEGMMGTLAAFRMLNQQDKAAADFVARYAGEAGAARPAGGGKGLPGPADNTLALDAAIERGLKAEAAAAAKRLLDVDKLEEMEIVNRFLMPALDRVGQGFEAQRVFLPQLLAAAAAAQAAFEVVKTRLGDTAQSSGPPVVIATVQGDVHDIGKNIAKVLLENYGFAVVDLGRDVPPERVVEAVRQNGAALVGLSALMTTTLPAMARTIEALNKAVPACKVFVAGAVLTEDYANAIGADFFAKDANASAEYAKRVLRG
ncbi:MAG: dihydropteroate synthase [Ruminococcaceae bacterium]|nr:dihydropteroate synthase [Oscillospiraceae bacterium]